MSHFVGVKKVISVNENTGGKVAWRDCGGRIGDARFGRPDAGCRDARRDIGRRLCLPPGAVDFVLPERFAAVDVTPAMVTVDGAPAAAVVPIDPTSVFVSLVVDDGPAVPAEVVAASQGGALELVRTIDAGTSIAVATPSGLQTAFTADPSATMARIAGIIAGAPAVTPLPQLILDAAAALGTADTPDRHLVVVLGGPLGASEEQLSQLAILVASNGITLHLVSAAGAAEPALIPIAEQSGGSVPIAGETLASFDAVTAAISDRYRVTTTVGTPGEHMIALTVNGETIQAVVTVSPPTTRPRRRDDDAGARLVAPCPIGAHGCWRGNAQRRRDQHHADHGRGGSRDRCDSAAR